ncbi:hypothetical protein [Streptomyces sp. NPDC001774]
MTFGLPGEPGKHLSANISRYAGTPQSPAVYGQVTDEKGNPDPSHFVANTNDQDPDYPVNGMTQFDFTVN